MQICSTCKVKPAIPPSKSGRKRYNCKECLSKERASYYIRNKAKVNAYMKKRAQDMAQFIIELKNKPCVDCKQSFPSYCMDFDHRDPSVKVAEVSYLRKASKQAILKEAAKCDLVCANCHRIRTHARRTESN